MRRWHGREYGGILKRRSRIETGRTCVPSCGTVRIDDGQEMPSEFRRPPPLSVSASDLEAHMRSIETSLTKVPPATSIRWPLIQRLPEGSRHESKRHRRYGRPANKDSRLPYSCDAKSISAQASRTN